MLAFAFLVPCAAVEPLSKPVLTLRIQSRFGTNGSYEVYVLCDYCVCSRIMQQLHYVQGFEGPWIAGSRSAMTLCGRSPRSTDKYTDIDDLAVLKLHVDPLSLPGARLEIRRNASMRRPRPDESELLEDLAGQRRRCGRAGLPEARSL
jgi:hypothetical protein